MNKFSYINGSLSCTTCGSTRISKRYIHDSRGEVDGQSLRCVDCNAFDPGW